MRWLLLLALTGSGCLVEERVLEDPVGVVTSCDEAWQTGQIGAACAFDAICDRVSDMCCTEYAYCGMEGLVIDVACDPSCGCAVDEECEFGAAICEGVCQACPSTDACGACPDGWVPLTRNGCPTCACAPPAECDINSGACEPNGAEVCYPGQSCADGCDASQPGCCSNACSVEGCVDAAPVGCLMDCAPDSGCTLCAAEACECDGVAWQCSPRCVDDLRVTCVYP